MHAHGRGASKVSVIRNVLRVKKFTGALHYGRSLYPRELFHLSNRAQVAATATEGQMVLHSLHGEAIK